jgi:hypothetical protein
MPKVKDEHKRIKSCGYGEDATYSYEDLGEGERNNANEGLRQTEAF